MDDMFASMFGGAAGPSRSRAAPPGQRKKSKSQSQSSSAEISVTLEDLFVGKEKKIDIERVRSCSQCKG